ncbi:MAG: antibiotic biosynthesis monooxygenase [Anaerolineae bacterium]|nr:antibiotic biosynthesis monooxygenase [Anaerolineae bacterium]
MMMVLYVAKWDILPDKVEAYTKWVGGANQRQLAVPGVVEFRAYRAAVGTPQQVIVTYEFADMAAWAAWWANEDVQKTRNELRLYATGYSDELWGPSPVIPKPIRPGQ